MYFQCSSICVRVLLSTIYIATLIQDVLSHADGDLWIPVTRQSTTCLGERVFLKTPNAANNWGEETMNEFMQLGYYEGYGLGWPGRELYKVERPPVSYGCWFELKSNYPLDEVQYINLGNHPLVSPV